MDTLLLIFLIVLDIALLGYVYFAVVRRQSEGLLMSEIREERRIIDEMRASLKDSMLEIENKARSWNDKLIALASEAEIEHEKIKKLFDDNSESLLKDFELKLDQPIKNINNRCEEAHRVLLKIKKEKQSLLNALKKAEVIAKFFNKDLSYQDLLEEIEDKKYIDARHMLSKGVKPHMVAQELNMPESEVRLLLSL